MPHSIELRIPQAIWQSMKDHVDKFLQEEACGVLAGLNGNAELMIPIPNELGSPVRFRMEPSALLETLEQIESLEMEMLAIFHSHPKGPEFPSSTDIAESVYPVVNIIWSPVNGIWQARGFWIEGGDFDEILLHVG